MTDLYQAFLLTDFDTFGDFLDHQYLQTGKMSLADAEDLVRQQRDRIQAKIRRLQRELEHV